MGNARLGARAPRFAAITVVALALAGCSMGNMFAPSSGTTGTQQLATAAPDQTAIAQANPLPVIATTCPPIKVRPGGEAMFLYAGGRTGSAENLQYQAVLDEVTRNCVVSNGLITVNAGAAGRVLLGPKGSQTSVSVPVRIAVERDGLAIFSEKYNLSVALPPPAQSAEFTKVVNGIAIPYVGGEDITIWVGFDPRG